MAKNILVVADVRRQSFRQVTKEMLGVANQLADGGRVHVAVVGYQVNIPDLGALGADFVWVVDHSALEKYTPFAYRKAVLEIYKSVEVDILLFAHSAIGKDVAPMVAMRLGVGQISDVTDIDASGPVFTRPIYAGKAYTKVAPKSEPYVVTIRPNNFPVYDGETKVCEQNKVDLSFETPDLATTVREIIQKASSGVDLTEAKVVVSGGRGVKSADGFEPLRELADVLGAAVGASRGACDAGYCDYALQIGQTGKVVTPDLYIACGISGAIQHLAGMSNSKVIVAINKDPQAPIFQIADYGIVGDLFEVVPLLTEEFKKLATS